MAMAKVQEVKWKHARPLEARFATVTLHIHSVVHSKLHKVVKCISPLQEELKILLTKRMNTEMLNNGGHTCKIMWYTLFCLVLTNSD